MGELENIFSFLEDSGEKFHVNEKNLHDIELSVEEIFTNMVRHNSGSDQAIEISIESDNDQILTSVTDHEEQPFDLTKTGEINFDKYIAEKRSGGLGIFLVKKLMDDVKFEHRNGVSKITIIKNV